MTDGATNKQPLEYKMAPKDDFNFEASNFLQM